MTDDEIPTILNEPSQPTGKSWEEEDVEEIFPNIVEKFS